MRKLHSRLAAIDYLSFTDPGDDLYTEDTRKAVVAFQESQGLYPNGEVNPATWVALAAPRPPLPTPTPLPAAQNGAASSSIPDLKNRPIHTDEGQPIAYFTFDDGPGQYSGQVMDVLAKDDARATFFVLGKQVRAGADVVRAEVQAGHYIANHTYSHPSLEGISREEFIQEADETKQAILDVAGDLFTPDKDVRYLRPPYGATDANSRQYAAERGYTIVLWDIDPLDWRRPGAEVISDHIVRSIFPGAIVLMHDGGGERAQTVQALEMTLRELSAQGYVFRNLYLP